MKIDTTEITGVAKIGIQYPREEFVKINTTFFNFSISKIGGIIMTTESQRISELEEQVVQLASQVTQLASEVTVLKQTLAGFEQTVSKKLPTDSQESSVIADAKVTTIKADNIRIKSAEIK